MNALRQLWLAIFTSVVVFFRRLLHGPRIAGWSFRLEVLTAVLRTEVRRQTPLEPALVRRRTLDAPVPRSVAARLVRTTDVIAGVPVEVLTPRGWEPDGPTVLYLHGGGYAVCSPGTHRDLTSRLAASSEARLVVPDYRLAPEHPYPAAVDDTVAVWRALGARAVAGDSAGGGLCLALMLRLRAAGEPQPVAAGLISPWVDLTLSEASIDAHEHDYLDRAALERFSEHYLQGADPRGHEVSPVLAELHGLPPLLVMSGDAEVFHDEHQRLATAAEAAGVDVTLSVGQGMVHAWPAFAAVVPEGRVALDEVGAFLSDRLSGERVRETG